jgi:hypothetical protein
MQLPYPLLSKNPYLKAENVKDWFLPSFESWRRRRLDYLKVVTNEN